MAPKTNTLEQEAPLSDQQGRMRLATFDLDLNHEPSLVQLAQEGDRQACAALVDRYWPRLYRWLFHLTHNQHGAEDLVQETFLKAFSKLSSFRAESNFQAWLFRIVRFTTSCAARTT